MNKAKKSSGVVKISTIKRNVAKFLAKTRDIHQNRKARISSRQSFKKKQGEKRLNSYRNWLFRATGETPEIISSNFATTHSADKKRLPLFTRIFKSQNPNLKQFGIYL